jgi:hypothetical protein
MEKGSDFVDFRLGQIFGTRTRDEFFTSGKD